MLSRRVLALACVSAAVFAFGQAGWIHAKAQLAQWLLEDAWDRSRAGEARAAPWPWADTWPVARLEAPGHAVSQIVLSGATGRTLAFGPGHHAGSATPGAPGNVVLAGHRDTHFAFLRDVAPGDRLALEAPDGQRRDYRVVDRGIVHESNLAPLEDWGVARLTLITCYPFDAVHAGGPWRFVVVAHAAAAEGDAPS
ncbi:MAG: class GN sortase [Proteobacteria bacterium]|nr:class GN sortase [Pseudomonadota bacterium]